MSLELNDIQHLAKLSRLALKPQEEEHMQNALNHILELIDELQAIDTQNVQPLAHPVSIIQDSCLRLREDTVTESPSKEKRASLMSNAPAQDQGLFLAPRVIE